MNKPLSRIAKEFGISFAKAALEFSDKKVAKHSENYGVPMYDEDTVNKTAIEYKEFQYFNWYCDNCGAFLNHQPGFRNNNGTWKCECCGNVNNINEDNLTL